MLQVSDMRSLHSEDTRSSGLTAGFALNEPLLHSSEVARLEAELGGNDAPFAEALCSRQCGSFCRIVCGFGTG